MSTPHPTAATAAPYAVLRVDRRKAKAMAAIAASLAHTTHSEARQFYGAVQAAKGLPQRVKLPPAPKAPAPRSGIAASAADTLGSVLGIETVHQRAVKAHAEAMKQWKETCKKLRQQDGKAWNQLNALVALSQIVRRQRSNWKSCPQAAPAVSPKPFGRPKMR